jgi:hypothetical protein
MKSERTMRNQGCPNFLRASFSVPLCNDAGQVFLHSGHEEELPFGPSSQHVEGDIPPVDGDCGALK